MKRFSGGEGGWGGEGGEGDCENNFSWSDRHVQIGFKNVSNIRGVICICN